MMRLIVSEFKKIFKSKMNLVLLIVLMMFSGVRIYQQYHKEVEKQDPIEYTDVDGKVTEGLEYWKLADKIQHSYAGELTDKKIKQMYDDFIAIMDSHKTEKVDKEYMTKIYGENFEENIQKAQNGEFTLDEFFDSFPNYFDYYSGYGVEEIPNSNKVKFHGLRTFMEGDSTAYLYQNIYKIIENTDDLNNPHYSAWWSDTLHDWLNAPNKTLDQLTKEFAGLNKISSKAQATIQAQVKRYATSSHKIDSNIGNSMFVNSLYNLEFVSLLILVIILSNTFAMEKHHKTDQIITPTLLGARKVTIAKISTGILLALGIVAAQLCLLIVMSYIFLPIRDLSLTAFNQSGMYINAVSEFMYTYKELIFNGIFLISIAALATSCVTMLISYITKNRFATVIPLLIILLITGFTDIFNRNFPSLVIDQFFPSQMVHFTQFFNTYFVAENGQFVPYVNLFHNIIAWKDIIMIFWIIISVLICVGIYLHSKKHTVKNC